MLMIIQRFFNDFLFILSEMAPYLLFGFLIAGILHEFLPKTKIDAYFGNNNLRSITNASILGVPLPLCSCGVIPTGIALYKNGASKSATVSFLISTPQTGVDSILVTYSFFGLPFAIIRPVVAFISGVFGGVVTGIFNKKDKIANDGYQNGNQTSKQKNVKERLKGVFQYGFVEFLNDISKWLVIGLLLAAFISIVIPNNFILSIGFSPLLQMLLVLMLSIPLYICATASVPLAAILIVKGLSPGAALVLLMAGPATNAATITIIGKVLGRRTLIAYLFSIIFGALFFGFITDYFLPQKWFVVNHLHHFEHQHTYGVPTFIPLISSILLIGLLIYGRIYKRLENNKIKIKTMNVKTIKVDGMTCNHCKANVENHLKKLDFVKQVSIDLTNGSVAIESDTIDLEKVKSVVEGLGYKYLG